IGPLALEKQEGPVFLGMQNSKTKDYSEAIAEKVDSEIQRIVSEGRETALRLLKDNDKALVGIAEALLEFETVDGHEVDLIIAGQTVEDLRKRRDDQQNVLAEEQKAAEEEDRKKE